MHQLTQGSDKRAWMRPMTKQKQKEQQEERQKA